MNVLLLAVAAALAAGPTIALALAIPRLGDLPDTTEGA